MKKAETIVIAWNDFLSDWIEQLNKVKDRYTWEKYGLQVKKQLEQILAKRLNKEEPDDKLS